MLIWPQPSSCYFPFITTVDNHSQSATLHHSPQPRCPHWNTWKFILGASWTGSLCGWKIIATANVTRRTHRRTGHRQKGTGGLGESRREHPADGWGEQPPQPSTHTVTRNSDSGAVALSHLHTPEPQPQNRGDSRPRHSDALTARGSQGAAGQSQPVLTGGRECLITLIKRKRQLEQLQKTSAIKKSEQMRPKKGAQLWT